MLLTALPLLVALLAVPARADPCTDAYLEAEVMEMVMDAYQAFRLVDEDRFARSRDEAIARLSCVTEPIQRAEAARIHGMMALDAFLREDEAAVLRSLRAVAAADPYYEFPDRYVPHWHPLHVQLTEARTVPGDPPRPFPDQRGDRVAVDGRPAHAVVEDRPVVVQRFAGGLVPTETLYHRVDEEWPTWLLSTEQQQALRTRTRQRHVALGVVTGVAAAGAGTLAVLAVSRNQQAENTTDAADQAALESQASTATAFSVISAAGALGAGVALVVTW